MPRVAINAKQYAMSDFGKHLKSCRDMKQAELAGKLGVTQQSVSNMEKNPGGITLERLYDVNQVVRLDMIQILKAAGYKLPEIRDYFRPYFADHK